MQESEHRISMRDVLFVIFTKVHVFKWILAVVVVLTNGVAFLSAPIYSVSSQILLKPSFDSNLLFEAPVRTLQASPVTPQQVNSEISIMLSDGLLRRVVEDLALHVGEKKEGFISNLRERISGLKSIAAQALGSVSVKDPIEQAVSDLKDSLIIKPVTMSNMIEVSLKGKDPERITDIINTFVDRYVDQHIQVHQAPAGEDFFKAEAVMYQKKLGEAEEALRQFQLKESISDLAAQRAGNLDVLKLLRENLTVVNGQIAEQATRLSLNKQDLEALTKENSQNAILSDLTRALLPLLIERSRVATLYPKSSIEYQDLNNQVTELTDRLKSERSSIITGAEIDLEALIKHQQEYQQTIAELEKQCVALTENEVELKRLQRSIFQYEKLYLLYKEKAEEARIEKQKDMARVSNVAVSSWAVKPTVPIFPKRFLMAVLSIVVGLILGIAGAFTAYYLDHTIKMPQDLPRYAGIPAISAINIVEKRE